MRVLLLGACPAFLALALVGCGGGGGGGSPTPSPGPGPGPSPPPTIDVSVLSYNLEWHKTGGGPDVSATINSVGPFDLMGFQECDSIGVFIKDIGAGKDYGPYEFKQGPQDIAMAWNSKKFKKVKEGMAVAGHDGWGERDMHWVRLNIIDSTHHIFLANTHGPVNQCSGEYEDWKNVAHNYVKAITSNMEPGDHLFFTGDFNCGSTPLAGKNPHGHGLDQIISEIRKNFTDIGQASFFYPILYQPDRIYVLKNSDIETVSWDAMCCNQPGDCSRVEMKKDDPEDPDAPRCVAYPSDHALLRGRFKVPVPSSTPLPSVV